MSSKLAIALGVLIVLIGVTVLQFNAEKAADDRENSDELTLPKLEKEKIDQLEVAAPGKPKVVVKHEGDGWLVVDPVRAPASQNAVDTALDKLVGLEVTGTAATKASNHEVLEVTADKGIHVVAKNGEEVLADLWIGSYRGGNTMVRKEGDESVAAVQSAIRYAFDKEVKEWRDRTVTDEEVDQIARLTLKTPEETIVLVRDGDTFKQAEGETPIENFDASKARSLVSSVARLSTVDFAKDDITPEAAGTAEGELALVTVELDGDAGTQQIVLKLGKKVDSHYYLQREGRDELFLVSSFIGNRLSAGSKELQKSAEDNTAVATPTPAMPGPGAGPHGQLPPELLKQLQQQAGH